MRVEKWNESWKFWEDKDAFAMVWNVPDIARDVTIPHDAMIEKPAYAESPNGNNTGFRDGGNYTYVKLFELKEEDLGKKRILRFDGVYCHALVYVNEQFAGGEANGYATFYVDITPWLKTGTNEVRVQVKNGGMTNSRWYSGSGIYRDVWMMTSGATYFEPDMVRVVTETVDEGMAVISLSAMIVNEALNARTVTLATRINAEGGSVAGSENSTFFIKSGERKTVTQRILINDANLWSDESPDLYSFECALCEGRGYSADKLIDCAEDRFGIRTLSVDAARGLRVNGRSVKLRGACIHHDTGMLGAASFDDAVKRQIAGLKEAGFNAVRISHHPAAPALMRACDEVGVYIMDEFSDMWTRNKSDLDYSLDFEKWWRTDAELMVRKDFNHPSVVMYSIGNEIPEIGLDAGSDYCAQISEVFRTLDPTRFTTACINGAFAAGDGMGRIVADLSGGEADAGEISGNVNDFMTLMDTKMDQIVTHDVISERIEKACASLDIAGFNYMAARYEPDSVNYPNRVIVGSETYPPEIARNWALVKKLPSVIGDFTWTGWEYIGEAGVGVPAYKFGEGGFGAQFPCQLSYAADIDLTGFRRPLSYYREIVFGLRHEPYIAVQDPHHYGEFLIKTPWVMSDAISSWTWKGFEGKPAVVEIYSDADEVELIQDGRSLGKKIPEAFKALFETEYEPGELMAVAYTDGKESGSFVLKTAGEAQPVITKSYDGEELVYLDIELKDEDGTVSTDNDLLVTAEVCGAELLGIGSGNPKPVHNYNEGKTYTWNGRAQMVLRKTGDRYSVKLSAEDGRTAEYSF